MSPPMVSVPGGESRSETALANISSALWGIRELLELLTFKLETEQVLVAAGQTRWLGRATHEVELVLEEIRHADLRRTIELGEAAEVLGLDPDVSLRELAEAAPSPWDEVLTDHRDSLVRTTAEITALAESNRQLLDYELQRAQRGPRPRLQRAGPLHLHRRRGEVPAHRAAALRPVQLTQTLSGETVIATSTPPRTEADALDQPEIHFPAGLVGFPDARRFLLEQGDGGVFELRGLGSEDPDFVVVAPAPFLPDYAPVIDDETVERLDLQPGGRPRPPRRHPRLPSRGCHRQHPRPARRQRADPRGRPGRPHRPALLAAPPPSRLLIRALRDGTRPARMPRAA